MRSGTVRRHPQSSGEQAQKTKQTQRFKLKKRCSILVTKSNVETGGGGGGGVLFFLFQKVGGVKFAAPPACLDAELVVRVGANRRSDLLPPEGGVDLVLGVGLVQSSKLKSLFTSFFAQVTIVFSS